MDLSKITDIDKLKSMAYDQLVQKQIAEQNLQAINQRIEEVVGELNKQEKEKPPKKSS